MDGLTLGPNIDLPINSTRGQLELIVNELKGDTEKFPFAFYVDDNEILDSLEDTVREQVIPFRYNSSPYKSTPI